MKTSRKLALTLLGACVLHASAAAAADKPLVIAGAKIRFSKPHEIQTEAGLLYSGTETLDAELVFVDAADRQVGASCPVIVKTRALGLTAMLSVRYDREFSLGNAGGKPARSLLGTYYGAGLGAALSFGAGGMLAVNSHGVTLADAAFLFGVGADLSVPAVTLFENSRASATHPGCDWNRRLWTSDDYLEPSAVSDTRDAGKCSGQAKCIHPTGPAAASVSKCPSAAKVAS